MVYNKNSKKFCHYHLDLQCVMSFQVIVPPEASKIKVFNKVLQKAEINSVSSRRKRSTCLFCVEPTEIQGFQRRVKKRNIKKLPKTIAASSMTSDIMKSVMPSLSPIGTTLCVDIHAAC